MFPITEIASSLRRYESVVYNCSLRKDVKKEILELVKDLNVLLKTDAVIENDRALQLLKKVSTETLELYSAACKTGKTLPIDRSLQWMSSKLFGNFYPPVDPLGTFVNTQESLHSNELQLSPQQEQLLERWVEIEDQDWSNIGLEDIYQDFIQDCSFVATLISMARNNDNLLRGRVFPHASHIKRLGVILRFNGCERLVEVDSKLPELRNKSLYIKSKTNPKLLWPAFLEKAYLKIRGNGYDSKGSNANIDTFIISGWIPEFHTALENPSMPELWENLAENFNHNRLVLNIGTSSDSKEYFPNHDFAIIGIDEEFQVLSIKNPWNKHIYKVKFSEIFDYFETLYVNWNPEVFKSHESIHLTWNVPENSVCIFDKPQFHLKNTSDGTAEIWVLLEKHLGFPESSIGTIIYRTSGHKLFSRTESFARNPSNNTGFHLTKLKLTPQESATVVVYNDSHNLQNFTLHAYSTNEGLKLTKAQPELKHMALVDDEWDIDSCGGNWANNSYTKNPQYELYIPGNGELTKNKIGLFTNPNIMVNYQLFWSDEIPFNDSNSSIVKEKYRAGSLTKEVELQSGQIYKLVVSTYSQDTLAKFKLLVNSEKPVVLKRVSNRLGLFSRPFKFQWNNKNRFKLNLKVDRETRLNIHLWSQHSYSEYRPKIRASLFYKSGQAIQVNNEFSDNLYGVWLQNVTVKPIDVIILLIERFEVGDDELFGEIGSDIKIDII